MYDERTRTALRRGAKNLANQALVQARSDEMRSVASGKRLGILLFSTPYGYESTDTAVKIAETALRMGHQVSIFAYGDGVHGFTVGQKPKGIPNAEQNISRLIDQGLDVQLCGTCLNYRGIADSLLLKGAKRSSLSNLCKLISKSDVFITFA